MLISFFFVRSSVKSHYTGAYTCTSFKESHLYFEFLRFRIEIPDLIVLFPPGKTNYCVFLFLQLLDTLQVCQDFNRGLCTRPTCKFVHLQEGE